MKKLMWFIIVILLVLFIPVIPYDNEVQDGVTRVEYNTIFSVIKDRYEKEQAKKMEVVSPEVSEVPEGGMDAEGEHVQ
jgi:uncharacterized membrane protein